MVLPETLLLALITKVPSERRHKDKGKKIMNAVPYQASNFQNRHLEIICFQYILLGENSVKLSIINKMKIKILKLNIYNKAQSANEAEREKTLKSQMAKVGE